MLTWSRKLASDTIYPKPVFGLRLRIPAPTNSVACGRIFGLWMAAFQHWARDTPDKTFVSKFLPHGAMLFYRFRIACLCRFILLLLAVLNLGTLVRIFPPLAKLPGVTSFRDAIGAMWADKRLLAGTFSATVAYWLILGPLGYLLGTNMGIELHAFQFTLVVLGAIFFATTIPGLPGAAGTFEFAVVYLLNLWEVPQATALGFGVILHLVLFLPPVLIAAVVLPREGFVSVRAFRERARAVREKRGAEGPSGV